jgi:GntR family transcriptional regulator
LVEKRRTTGTFVAELPKRLTVSQRRKLMAPEIDRVLITARQLGIDWEDLQELLSKRESELSAKVSKKEEPK